MKDYIKQLEAENERLKKELEKNNYMDVGINNKQVLRFTLKDQKLLIKTIDPKGAITRIDGITEGDLVMLYNYYIDRIENNLEIF